MNTETEVLTSAHTEVKLDFNCEKSSVLDNIDWSSVDDGTENSRYLLYSISSIEIPIKFKPVPPSIFKKASKKWLNANSPNKYSLTKNTSQMSKDKVAAGKVLQSFENYLSIVTMMYFGDPFSTSLQGVDVFRPGKRARSRELSDPLSMILSPLRSEHEFGKKYSESWSPKQVAVFESTLCSFGKKFELVEKLLGSSKSLVEITQFFYMWKKSSHYRAWKEAVRANLAIPYVCPKV